MLDSNLRFSWRLIYVKSVKKLYFFFIINLQR